MNEELSVNQALRKGVDAHKAGKVQEADRYYTAILKAQPKHPDANHNMGVLAVGVGKVETALPFFKTALEAKPKIAQFWLSYIDALIKLERVSDAKAVFDQAKSNGAKGDGFDRIELQLNSSSVEVKNNTKKDTPTQLNILDELKLDKATTLAKNKVKDGLNEEAKKIYQDILEKFPKNKKALDGIKTLASKTLANTSDMQMPPGDQLQSPVNLYRRGQHQEALTQAVQLLKQFPTSVTLYNIIGAANNSMGKLEEAIEAYKKVISFKPDFAEAYYNMGNALKDQGKLKEAMEAYTKALSIKPDLSEAYNNMGATLKKQGKLEEAIEACFQALSIKPDYAEAYYNMGNALKDQGKLEEAIEAYTKALLIKPDYADVWLSGAEFLENWNKLDELEIWLDKAFNSFETVPADLRFIKSKLLWRNKKGEETFNLLSDIEIETISEPRRQDYFQLKAKCFEQSKKFKEAYECFAESNSLAKKSKEYLSYNSEQYFQNIKDKLTKIKSSSNKKRKARPSKSSEFSPTFLVGFPRSGTTLLDTILRSNTKIEVMEEQPVIMAAESFLRQNGYNDFAGQLVTHQLSLEAQKIYRREFNKHIDTTSVDKVYVDKLPLSLLRAPLIHQMYPDAKFILALRHPMDTILSCWMQNFKLNAAMANMVDLNRIVDFYCIAMEVFQICRTNYNLNVHEIRYEDLINNFQKESETVVQFLNLQWEPEMAKYQETALKRGRINTPSYSQVVQPIYKDAQYRWLNYRKYLEPYLDQVTPWISEFGYN